LTKWYFLGPLRVASQATSFVGWETAALDGSLLTVAASSLEHPALILVLAREARGRCVAALLCVVVGLLAAPWRRRPVIGIAVRPSHAILVALACAIGMLPWPVAFRPTPVWALGSGGTVIRHYHLDHLGSTQVVTDTAGDIVEQIRYLPYGTVRGHWNRGNTLIADPGDGNRREFTGYISEPLSGLQSAGARVYDPDLGSFLTQDPATQFASPYSYGGGDPVNWTDPTGEDFISGLLIALVVGTLASAAINAVIAAAQGLPLSAIGKAALGGAIAGAVGVGLGVVVGAASMGTAHLAGTLAPNVTFDKALEALGEVAERAAFSSTIANTAGQVAAAAGAPGEVTTAVAMVTGLVGSFGYDQFFRDPNGELAHIEGYGGFRECSTTRDHTDITTAAAQDAGFRASETRQILDANLARDRGWQSVLNNEDHFDFGAQRAFRGFAGGAEKLVRSQTPLGDPRVLAAIGAATHHLQDQFALGHIFPGTSELKSFWGAVPRFIIHNVVGGEVTFRQASYDASLQFLRHMHGLGNSI
jgi:RHS repeat-associated protein